MKHMRRPSILFIFPHPDDESFLTGGTIAKYAHSGAAEVFLYTLTRGEASRNAALQGMRPEELAELRVKEVSEAAKILGVSEHVQGAWPDGGLRDLDPRELENDFEAALKRFDPDVLVTFDAQGGSAHPDHIVAHQTLKRVFAVDRERRRRPLRLCFCGLPAWKIAAWPRKVFGIPEHRIHAAIDVSQYREIEKAAIEAHYSVRRDVADHNYDGWMSWETEYYSFFQETLRPPVDDLLSGLR